MSYIDNIRIASSILKATTFFPMKIALKNYSSVIKHVQHGFLSLARIWIPMNCPLCGGIPVDGRVNMFCRDCLNKMPFLHPPYCDLCGGELNGILSICTECCSAGKLRPWHKARAVFRMEGESQKIIHAFKYRNKPELVRGLGYFAYERVKDLLPEVDMVVPVPLHWTRLWKRGYNQQALIAGQICRLGNVPMVNALIRKKATEQQAKRSRKSRLRNINRAFSINHQTNVENRAILLVDDVMTTGATLAAASRVLLNAGASKVYVLVIARRQRK